MEKNEGQAANNGVTQHEVIDDGDNRDNMDEDAQVKERLTSEDPIKVKFTSVNLDGYVDKNGEAKVDIQVAQTSVGMGKEELMKYANEPFWVRLRMFLFVLFWLAWVAMLVGAVAIILLAPRCPPAPRLEWHQKAGMYRVQIKSFKDSDGDGVGDIKGLISKLDYFKDINVGTLLLSAFYSTDPGSEGVVNHVDIDSKLGTMADFEKLLTEMKEKDMKLVIDFNPNHSGDQHPWFKASVKNEEPYKDFYVWANPASDTDPTVLPNNWLSVNDESVWEWNEERKQYYLHTYSKNEPDLNLRNPEVREELKKILAFWLEKGVDGFKVIAASHLVEDSILNKDEPLKTNSTIHNPRYEDKNHISTVGKPENFELLAEWREILTNFSISTGLYKILVADVSESVNDSMRYYGTTEHPLTDFPINIQLTKLDKNSTAFDLKRQMDSWLMAIPKNMWPNWLLGSELTERLAVRIGHDLIDGFHMVAILAKGTPITYYGDELGMDYEPMKEKHLPLNQSPMQWSNDTFGGFSNGSVVFAELNSNYPTVNVQAQLSSKQSHLKIYGNLLALRKQPAIKFGIQEYPIVTENIFSMLRVRKGSPGYLVVLNMGNETVSVDFSGKSSFLPENLKVEVKSHNIVDGPLAKKEHPKVKLNNITLGSKQSIVLTFVPQFED